MTVIAGCSTCSDYYIVNFRCGEIVDIGNNDIIFIIDCKDKVRIGQLVNVYKSIKASHSFTRRYKNITMGMAQITEFIDEHRAKAKILYGSIDKGCRVAL